MVHIDAHTDTWDEYFGAKFHHGSPFRLATEEGLLDPKRTIQIGIRGAQLSTEPWDYPWTRACAWCSWTSSRARAWTPSSRKRGTVVGGGPTYISFDVDGLDPVYAPGTGTPEVGGLTTLEAQTLLRGLRGLDIVGGDVVEVAPPFDPSGNTRLVGATMMYEILCLMAEAAVARRSA